MAYVKINNIGNVITPEGAAISFTDALDGNLELGYYDIQFTPEEDEAGSSSGSAQVSIITDSYTLTAGQTTVSLTRAFGTSTSMVYYNGLFLVPNVNYSVSGTTMTLGFSAEADDVLAIVSFGTSSTNIAELIEGEY